MDTEKHSRRNAIALMAGAVPALAATSAVAIGASSTDRAGEVSRLYEKRRTLRARKDELSMAMNRASDHFEEIKPDIPNKMRIENVPDTWSIWIRESVRDTDRTGEVNRIPPGRLYRLAKEHPDSLWLSEAAAECDEWSAKKDTAWESSGAKAAENAFYEAHDLLHECERDLITAKATTISEIQMQAKVLQEWLEACQTEEIQDDFLVSLLSIPTAFTMEVA